MGRLDCKLAKLNMTSKILKKEEVESRLDLPHEADAPTAPVTRGKVLRQDDLKNAAEASALVREAQAEAARVKAKARDILARVEEEAAKAREAGFAEGRDAGLASVTELLAQAHHHKDQMIRGFEKDVIRLVYDIAEKIIGRDLEEREGAVVDLICKALQVATGHNIIILVNPEDLDQVKKRQAQVVQSLDASRSIQIRASEKVAPRGCLIETEIGTIDAQLATQLEAIKRALGLNDEAPAGE